MDWYLKITNPYIQVPCLRTTPRRARGARDIATTKLQVVGDKAISMLDGALIGGPSEDISVIARKVRNMLFNARKEMAQDKGQEGRTKTKHDLIATPSSTIRALATKKALENEKGPAK